MSAAAARQTMERDPQALIERLRREGVLHSAAGMGAGARPRTLPTGVEELDRVLGGGLPRGRLVEVIGPVSSGRTALLFRVLASATARGEQTALIDAADAFDPDAGALAGVRLDRLLWVRPRKPLEASRAADLLLDAGGFGIVALDMRRPPAVVWPRLSLRAERSGSVLLVLGEHREAGTFASLVLGLRRGRARWVGGGASPLLLERLDARIEILRRKVSDQHAA